MACSKSRSPQPAASRSASRQSSAANDGRRTPEPDFDLSTIGPKVGEHVPDFRLPDQDGHLQTLESVAGPRGTMLVFFRSADW